MTFIVNIRPEAEAELARQAALAGSVLETYAAALLEDAADISSMVAPAKDQTGQSLIDAFSKIRGLFTDEEIDQMFTRNRTQTA